MAKVIDRILIILMFILSGIILVGKIIEKDYMRIFSCISILIVIIIPFILNKTRFKLEDKDKLVLTIFIFLADFLGSIVNLYNKIWWYDLFTHYLSGCLVFLIGLFILRKLNRYNNKDLVFNILFGISIVFLSAGLWEIGEFTCDTIMGSNLQHNIDTGVFDTMEDMIVAFLGGITVAIIYAINNKKK